MNEEEVFSGALEVAPAMRALFLKQVCGGDRAMEGRVKELLELHEAGDSLLDGDDAVFGKTNRDSAKASPPPSAQVKGLARPESFDGYELEGEIARGAMGVIYRARQPGLKRTVALKVIQSGVLAGKSEVDRFRAEIKAMARLDHPNIVPIYEAGESGGQHYFSMELIEGSSLADQMKKYRGKAEEAVSLIVVLARAVEAAHERGILHRDLKPANILIDKEGKPFVTDFGLARDGNRSIALTIHGQVMGTPSYMAPEQARGDIDAIAATTDVYGMGAVLYELLTQRPPHLERNLKETLDAVEFKAPVSPRSIDRSIDRDLEEIVLRCLAKDPKRRYGSMAEMAEALDEWLRGDFRLFSGLKKWVRRNPGAAVALAVTELALLAGLVWFWLWVSKVFEDFPSG